MDYNWDELDKESEAAKEKKALLGVAGTALQGMAGAPSFYEIYKGRSVGNKPDVKGMMDAVASGITDPKEKAAKSMQLAKMAYENQKSKREQGDFEKDSDPSSPASMSARAWAKANGLTVSDTDTAYDLERQYGLKSLIGKKFTDQADFQRQLQIAKLNHANAKEIARMNNTADLEKYHAQQVEKLGGLDPKSVEGRQAKLSAERQQRLDNARMGFDAVQKMQDALLNKGQNTFSVFGDNDFTMNRTAFEEALGRMQSGGAISKDEEKRFAGMAPTMMDSAEIQKKKLATLSAEMEQRMNALGFKPEEFNISRFQPKDGAGAGNLAQASGGKSIVKKQYSPSRNQTKIIYSDGSSEVVNGER